MSIRLRLTFWYSAVLLAGMALLGVTIFVSVRRSLFHSLEIELKQRAAGAAHILEELGPNASLDTIQDELREYAASVPEGRMVEVTGPDGKLIFPAERTHADPRRVRTLRVPATIAGRKFEVVVSSSLRGVHHTLENLQWILVWAIPATLLLAGMGGYWISHRALAPVDEITVAARTIGIRNLSQRLKTPGTGDELERLAGTWNEMLDRLETAVRRLTQFTADASHELRTPVALIRTTAELALRRERSTAEYREALRQIMAESEGTSQLVSDLLTLARADAGQGALPVQPLDLAQLVKDAGSQCAVLAQAKGVSLSMEIADSPVIVEGNAPALRRLLLILLDNAVKYTPEGGALAVSLSAQPSPALTVNDTGIGIADEVLPHIFERFFRADQARGHDGSSGLGLSIAKWIADNHRAAIEVHSEEGRGSTFRVVFHSQRSATMGSTVAARRAGRLPANIAAARNRAAAVPSTSGSAVRNP